MTLTTNEAPKSRFHYKLSTDICIGMPNSNTNPSPASELACDNEPIKIKQTLCLADIQQACQKNIVSIPIYDPFKQILLRTR
ncbi:hypothetical protein CEXT_457451 [Caerostris extrusa]|uniref:Uncharacterized protein n=1 Tax=Caerostris extrusa TaxID=172846 RepID=A0AAV4VJM7_CAEEX|nr:hypothetical protein CEXT_457451 [Caerostris extrusa]